MTAPFTPSLGVTQDTIQEKLSSASSSASLIIIIIIWGTSYSHSWAIWHNDIGAGSKPPADLLKRLIHISRSSHVKASLFRIFVSLQTQNAN